MKEICQVLLAPAYSTTSHGIANLQRHTSMCLVQFFTAVLTFQLHMFIAAWKDLVRRNYAYTETVHNMYICTPSTRREPPARDTVATIDGVQADCIFP